MPTWMVPAKDLKPGQAGIARNGDIIRKVGPLNRLERTDARGWKYTLPEDDKRYVFIGWAQKGANEQTSAQRAARHLKAA